MEAKLAEVPTWAQYTGWQLAKTQGDALAQETAYRQVEERLRDELRVQTDLTDKKDASGLYYPDLFVDASKLAALSGQVLVLTQDVQILLARILEFLLHAQSQIPLPLRVRSILAPSVQTVARQDLYAGSVIRRAAVVRGNQFFECVILRTPEDLPIVHEITVCQAFLNSLRCYTPAFRYYYGIFSCSSSYIYEQRVMWCKTENADELYIAREHFPSAQTLRSRAQHLSLRESLLLCMQVVSALAIAQLRCGFMHNRLTVDNILISTLSEALSVPILGLETESFAQTKLVLRITDYQDATYTVSGEPFGPRAAEHFSSRHDLLSLFHSWHTLLDKTNKSVSAALLYFYRLLMQDMKVIPVAQPALAAFPAETRNYSLLLIEELRTNYGLLFHSGPLTRCRVDGENFADKLGMPNTGSALAYCLCLESTLPAPSKDALTKQFDYRVIYEQRDNPKMQALRARISDECALVHDPQLYQVTAGGAGIFSPAFYAKFLRLLREVLLNRELLVDYEEILRPAQIISSDYAVYQPVFVEQCKKSLDEHALWLANDLHDWRNVARACLSAAENRYPDTDPFVDFTIVNIGGPDEEVLNIRRALYVLREELRN